jgi:cobalt-zinc-cadmium efflux system outer membrane protein
MDRQKRLYIVLHGAICFVLIISFGIPLEIMAAEESVDPAKSIDPAKSVGPAKLDLPRSQMSFDSDLISSPASTRTFSLSACFDKADRDNKDLVVARKNLAIAEAGIKIAGALPNPLIQLQTGFGPSFTDLFTGQTQQIFFTQQLLTAGKRSKKIAVARAFYDLTVLQLEALRFDVHNRVRRAYAEQAAAEAYAALIQAQREVGIKLATIAKNRFNAGKASKSEALQADLNVMQFDTQRNQAQGRLQQASAALALVTGERPEHIEVIDVNDNGLFKLSSEKTEIVPSPNAPLPTLDELLTTAYGSRIDLQALRQQVFVNRRALSVARAQRIPNLFVGAGLTFSTFGKGQPVGLTPQSNWLGNGFFLNVSAETPIFYQYQGEIAQAVANLRNSERQVDLLKLQISTALVIAYNSVKVARANIFVFQKDLLPLAAQVSKLARRGYEVGATDLATAIMAQQQYQQTLSNYFDAVVAYQNASADLERAVGIPLRY